MVTVDEAGRHAMEATDRSKTEGIVEMPTTIRDPLETGGVKAVPGSKQRPKHNVAIVARKTTERASAGRSAPI